MQSGDKRFLFLQGVCSPFFAQLAAALSAAGVAVHRLNFNAGDVAYGWAPAGWCSQNSFRGSLKRLPTYFEALCRRYQITDIVLFGDQRPVHRAVLASAQALNLTVHVFEEGYFRPHWVTMERGGVNAASRLPRDAGWYLAAAQRLPDLPEPIAFVSPFWRRALHDVLYHCAGSSNWWAFPRYRTHAPVTAPGEYWGYVRKWLKGDASQQGDAAVLATLALAQAPYWVLPLQLDGDAQIRAHSRFANMATVMAEVVASFAQHAPAEAMLVVKCHPLDNGRVNHAANLQGIAAQHGVNARVVYIASGNLEALLVKAQGCVTVNSTVGAIALSLNCPTIALSAAFYALPGLTFQGDLAAFWQQAQAPDQALFAAFRKVVLATTQLNGGFYCPAGAALAVPHAVTQLLAPRSALEDLLQELASAS